ncbi:unnamed protein product [Ambrosiozyma monospora]|uniref:Unnamed protein product n=1 Tax=Ambrosiozyma monospora TaxID=43982 RepID=A0A9W6Z1M5_AMBMO|nr:unnamed protein product [Ambrosiozyma monospora]
MTLIRGSYYGVILHTFKLRTTTEQQQFFTRLSNGFSSQFNTMRVPSIYSTQSFSTLTTHLGSNKIKFGKRDTQSTNNLENKVSSVYSKLLQLQNKSETHVLTDKIYQLLNYSSPKASSLRFDSKKYLQVFKSVELRPGSELPVVVNQLDRRFSTKEWSIIIDLLTSVKYINSSHQIGKFLGITLFDNDNREPLTLDSYNDIAGLISYSLNQRDIYKLFTSMKRDSVSANTTTYNIIAKNCIDKAKTEIAKIKALDLTLHRMIGMNLQPDFCTWYLALLVIPFDDPTKELLKKRMTALKLNQHAPYTDACLHDMLNRGSSVQSLEKLYLSAKRVSTNSMNTVIYKHLRNNDLHSAWVFFEKQVNGGVVNPKRSTLTMFINYCVKVEDLRMAVAIINTFRISFNIDNWVSYRCILYHLLKLPDGELPFYFPLLVKFFVWYDLNHGIDRFRRIDKLLGKLQDKLDNNYDKHLSTFGVNSKVDEFGDFELIFFETLKILKVEKSAIKNLKSAKEDSFSNNFTEPDTQLVDENWILTALFETCQKWFENIFINHKHQQQFSQQQQLEPEIQKKNE